MQMTSRESLSICYLYFLPLTDFAEIYKLIQNTLLPNPSCFPQQVFNYPHFAFHFQMQPVIRNEGDALKLRGSQNLCDIIDLGLCISNSLIISMVFYLNMRKTIIGIQLVSIFSCCNNNLDSEVLYLLISFASSCLLIFICSVVYLLKMIEPITL